MQENKRKQEYCFNKLKFLKKCVDFKKLVWYYIQADATRFVAIYKLFGGFDYVNIYGKTC